MVNLLKTVGRVAPVLFAAALAATAQQGPVARPGSVNYIEGQVTLNGQSLSRASIGSAEAAPGQLLETQNGRAEMLLTPGVFVRLNQNSAVRMISPDLVDTRVEVVSGEAMVEADYVTKDNHLAVIDHGITVNVEKNGVYDFNATNPMVSVYDGEARVTLGDKSFNVKKGHDLALADTGQKPKEGKFDSDSYNALYSWSRLRSSSMAQANEATVQNIFVGGYPGWGGGYGWYWNPYFDSFAFVPGYGYGYGLSPFGFAFYSPGYYGGFGYRYGRPGYFRGGVPATGVVRTPAPAFRGAGSVGGFHGNGGFGGGGFGGFHGGGRR